ncbi:hypothetical protein LTR08_000110 [Meristemomyces frigidus]|nr:hypothetical protein LTR08_000110 [Meristemomyces frigidus]
MEKLKDISKKGWKPPGDVRISRDMIKRDTWKSDLKGLATGKKKDPYEEQRNHESTPLSSLRDPDQFGPPPKHSAYYGNGAASPSRTFEPSGGLGAPVPAARPRQEEHVEEEPPRAPEPYRKDTSGLRTDNLPKPPVRRAMGEPMAPARTASPSLPPRTASPTLPPRQMPPLPVRQASKPGPGLPPRMTEHPDEHTPPPPPPYGEATQPGPEAGLINQGAVNRLAQAGVSVPGFGIGTQVTTPQAQARPSAPQLSELQQRFSRMNSSGSPASPMQPPVTVSPTAGKKAPPPPPPKKSVLQAGSRPQSSGTGSTPPPLPLSSKPRPVG